MPANKDCPVHHGSRLVVLLLFSPLSDAVLSLTGRKLFALLHFVAPTAADNIAMAKRAVAVLKAEPVTGVIWFTQEVGFKHFRFFLFYEHYDWSSVVLTLMK